MAIQSTLSVHRLFDEVLNHGDLDVIDEIVARDSVDNGSSLIGAGGGSSGFRRAVSTLRAAIPDLQFELADMIVAGDKVVARWNAHGTLRRELAGIPATGRRMDITGIVVYRLEDGRIQESWGNWDALGMMVQVGALKEPVPLRKLY